MIELGARNRAYAAIREFDADFGVGIENGLMQMGDRWFDPPCVVVVTRDGYEGIGYGGMLHIPDWAVEQVRAGRFNELGDLVKEKAGGGEKDPHNWFSDQTLRREEIVAQGVHMAFCPVLYPERYERTV